MSVPQPRPSLTKRIATVLFWLALWGLAAYGAFFLVIFVIGQIQYTTLDCGPRGEWTEENYSACSVVEETAPIFFRLGVPPVLPLLIALLIRFISRRSRAT